MSSECTSTSQGPSRPRGEAGLRLPLVVFGVVELIALPVLLELGRTRWFSGDDWYFLATRTSGGFRSVLTPNIWGHWLTLPILTYRLFWWLFGLRHFKAYLLLVIVLHLATVALLRAVMRRCGAGPWISTIAASMLLFFGAGAADILEPVQITFDGSLVFGLGHLLLADHDQKVGRRDFVGLACGLAGLMCSNVSIAMVATVGVAVLMRRGWRAALFHTVPLASIYLAWSFTYARDAHHLFGKSASVSELVPFIWTGLRVTFVGLGHFPIVAFVLVAMFALGTVSALVPVPGVSRRRFAAAGALAIGAVIFIASAGFLRASPALTPAHDARYVQRYVYVSAAMLLPALAVATTALVRRWRQAAPIAIVAMLVGLPGNYHELADFGAKFPKKYSHSFLVLAHSPVTSQLPPWMPVPVAGSPPYTTAGWLVAGVKSGHIPGPGSQVTAKEVATATLTLLLSPYVVASDHGLCRPVHTNTFALRTGDQIFAASGAVNLVYVSDSGTSSAPLYVVAPRRFQAFKGPLPLRVIRRFGPATLEVCTRR